MEFPEYIVPEGKIACDFCDKMVECLGDEKVNPAECKVIFVNGARLKLSKANEGSNNPRWKGGVSHGFKRRHK
jgi:hypothetical protein